MTPQQAALVKNDMTNGSLNAQILPLLNLAPPVTTLYDFPAGTPYTGTVKTDPFYGHNVVTYTINGIQQIFIALSPVPDDVYAAMSAGDRATLIATPVCHSQDQAIADLYNAVGSETLTLQFANKNDVLAVVEKAVMALPSAVAAVQTKWQTLGPMLIQLLAAADGQGIEQSKASGLQAAVTDGLVTATDAAAPWSRPCSHAETLLGAGWIMTDQQIGMARNS